MRFALYAIAVLGSVLFVENTQAVNLSIMDPPAAAAADAKADAPKNPCRDCCPKIKCGKCPCEGEKSLTTRVHEAAEGQCGDCKMCKKLVAEPAEKCTARPDTTPTPKLTDEEVAAENAKNAGGINVNKPE